MTRPSARRPHRGRPGTQSTRYIVRVLTEGKKTEPGYLIEWGRNNKRVHVQFSDYGMSPDALVKRAKAHLRNQPKRRERRDFDEIWCVFDTDEHVHLRQAITEAGHSGINVAVSNPCFELWLVLHVQDQTGYIDRYAVQRLSHQLGLSDGKRIAEAAKDTLIAYFQDAKRRAQELDQRHADSNSPARSNPSTDVWRLVDTIRA